MSETTLHVYQAISAITGKLAEQGGIAKDRQNEAQNYKFRGIDDVYNALAPLLAEYKLCILPRVVARTQAERTTIKEVYGKSKETTFFCITVEVEFDFVSSQDGSRHVVKTFGEAMDTGDKATNKAMSAAYKYACFQAFAIPVAGQDSEEDVIPIDRTKVMKFSNAISDASVNDRDLGVLENWHEAVEISEEFASAVWHNLTTPVRDHIRRLNDERRKGAEGERAAAK